MENPPLKKTALHALHEKLGAKLIDFNGWSMPLQYTSIMAEHLAVREQVGIFDVSHMGIFSFEGADLLPALNGLLANDLNKVAPGFALYSPLLYENGTFVDDVIVYLLEKNKARMVVNAGNLEKDYQWIEAYLRERKVAVKQERLERLSLLALQGKEVWPLLKKLFPEETSSTAKPFSLEFSPYRGHEVMLAKTGYTGEPGVELFVPSVVAAELFEEAVKLGAAPCGLGARDSLRLEKGYSLYGHEITEETNALEAGLGWCTALTKDEFIGKEALLKVKEEGLKRRLRGFVLEGRGVARAGAEVWDEAGKERLGEVTSGIFSPSLKKSLGLAYVKTGYEAKQVQILLRGKHLPARLTKRVFL